MSSGTWTRPLSVDFHTHILPTDIPDFEQRFGYEGFVTLADCGCNQGSKNMMLGSGNGEKKFFRKARRTTVARLTRGPARVDAHRAGRKELFRPGPAA